MNYLDSDKVVDRFAPLTVDQVHFFKQNTAAKYKANKSWHRMEYLQYVPVFCILVAILLIVSFHGYGPYQVVGMKQLWLATIIAGFFCLVLITIQWVVGCYAEGPARWSLYVRGKLTSCLHSEFSEWARKECPEGLYEIEILKRVNAEDNEDSLATIFWVYLPCEDGINTIKRGVWAAEAVEITPEEIKARREANEAYG